MTPHLDDDERRGRLAVRHGLTAGVADVTTLAEQLCGLHSTDPATVHLAAWARVPGFGVSDMEDALYDRRSLVRVLGMRRTLFVVPVEMAPLLQHGCAGPLASRERTRLIGLLESSGVADDGTAWLERVEEATVSALEERGQATATELTADVPELGEKYEYAPDKKYGGQFGMSTRVLFLLATDGRIVRGRPRGTWVSTQYRWAPLASWAPAAARVLDPDAARAELVRRWLTTFGPAPVSDLEWWTGWGKGATAKAVEANDVAEVRLDHGEGIALADDLEPTQDPGPWAALLPTLDSTVMGWKARDWFLGQHQHAVFDRNGNAGPTAWWNGRIVGGWTQRPDGTVVHHILDDIGVDGVTAIEAQAAALQEWLGDRRFVPRFRTPLDKNLSEG